MENTTDMHALYMLKPKISSQIVEINGEKGESLPLFEPIGPDHKVKERDVAISHILTFQNGNSLYLGSQEAAGLRKSGSKEDLEGDLERLNKLNIKAIATCRDIKPKFPNRIDYLVISMDKDNDPFVDISEKMETFYKFFSEKIQTGSVLVHCKHGRTRSATTVTYLLMRYLKEDFYSVREYLLTRRDCVKLHKYEDRLVKLYKKHIVNT